MRTRAAATPSGNDNFIKTAYEKQDDQGYRLAKTGKGSLVRIDTIRQPGICINQRLTQSQTPQESQPMKQLTQEDHHSSRRSIRGRQIQCRFPTSGGRVSRPSYSRGNKDGEGHLPARKPGEAFGKEVHIHNPAGTSSSISSANRGGRLARRTRSS